jgi:hypothetical protein
MIPSYAVAARTYSNELQRVTPPALDKQRTGSSRRMNPLGSAHQV